VTTAVKATRRTLRESLRSSRLPAVLRTPYKISGGKGSVALPSESNYARALGSVSSAAGHKDVNSLPPSISAFHEKYPLPRQTHKQVPKRALNPARLADSPEKALANGLRPLAIWGLTTWKLVGEERQGQFRERPRHWFPLASSCDPRARVRPKRRRWSVPHPVPLRARTDSRAQ